MNFKRYKSKKLRNRKINISSSSVSLSFDSEGLSQPIEEKEINNIVKTFAKINRLELVDFNGDPSQYTVVDQSSEAQLKEEVKALKEEIKKLKSTDLAKQNAELKKSLDELNSLIEGGK